MSKYQWIILLGVWVAVFLFLGFPTGWSKWIAVATGLVIVLVAYTGSRKQMTAMKSEPQKDQTSTYVENH